MKIKTMLLFVFLILLLPSVFAVNNLQISQRGNIWKGGIDNSPYYIPGSTFNLPIHPYDNTYEQQYWVKFLPDNNARSLTWLTANFESPLFQGIDKVVVKYVATSTVYYFNTSQSLPSYKTEVESKTYEYSADELKSDVYQKMFLKELSATISNMNGSINRDFSNVAVFIYTVYTSDPQAYSPVRVDANVATQGTDVCSLFSELFYNEVRQDSSTLWGYSKNLISLNIELFQILFWIIKILLFMVALGALFYLILMIVMLIKGRRTNE